MRHSVGSAWVFSICLAFIILFTCYLAITINYAKAFRIKTHIVDTIEENEGYPENGKLDDELIKYLTYQGYDASGSCSDYIKLDEYPDGSRQWVLFHTIDYGPALGTNNHNVCIYRMNRQLQDNEGTCKEMAYYKVIVFFKFDLPLLGYFTSFQVNGETRLGYDFANNKCEIN